jgi:hypothetical protein
MNEIEEPLTDAERAEAAEIANTIVGLYNGQDLGPSGAAKWIGTASSYRVAKQARDDCYGFLQTALQNPAATSEWTQEMGQMFDAALAAWGGAE